MPVIEAAGGLVWRRSPDGIDVLLVHRPRYDDWTLPIGRRESAEALGDCALREVAEETGYDCRLLGFLEMLTVEADDGIHHFHIYEMEPLAGGFVPNPETDQVEWLSTDAAIARATYSNVRDLLRSAAERLR